jgi:hypothetical protein
MEDRADGVLGIQENLRGKAPLVRLDAMKLFWSVVAYLVIGFVLGWGILLAVKGHYWLLIAGFIAYVVSFAKIGCLPKSSH